MNNNLLATKMGQIILGAVLFIMTLGACQSSALGPEGRYVGFSESAIKLAGNEFAKSGWAFFSYRQKSINLEVHSGRYVPDDGGKIYVNLELMRENRDIQKKSIFLFFDTPHIIRTRFHESFPTKHGLAHLRTLELNNFACGKIDFEPWSGKNKHPLPYDAIVLICELGGKEFSLKILKRHAQNIRIRLPAKQDLGVEG